MYVLENAFSGMLLRQGQKIVPYFYVLKKCLLRHVTSTRAETRMTLRPPASQLWSA